MDTVVLDAEFWSTTGAGLAGLLLWILASWANPADDTVTGTFRNAFGSHSRSILVAVIAYFCGALLFHSLGEWNIVSAVTTGYTGQSLVQKAIEAKAATLVKRP